MKNNNMFGIKELVLTNFRRYKKFRASFSEGINIIVGKNAVGKTTLVEAIYCLSFLKSYKTVSDQELITYGENNANIKGTFQNNDEIDEIVLSFYNNKKRIICNNKAFSAASEYLGYSNTIMFCPEDLGLVKGAPLGRRKFLNLNIGQLNKGYYIETLNYQKLLKNRNEFLKSATDDKKLDYRVLEIITTKLIESAGKLIDEREAFLKEIRNFVYNKGLEISNGKEKIEIFYKPNVKKSDLEKVFKEKQKYDEITKTTSSGPHRDDFGIYINGVDSGLYASQGQQRTIAIALKLGLLELIKKKSDRTILILDDVFSELDNDRQNELLKLLNMKNQIFITTTSVSTLSDEVLAGSKIIKLAKEE